MKVLLADSDLLFSRLVKSRLEKVGYSVATVPTGPEAWELFEHSRFRFVITEFDLPGLDGTELCRRIRNLNRRRHTYVMFYAARNNSDNIVEAYQAGADDFLGKPFNPTLLDLRLARGRQELNREDDLRVVANHDDATGFIKYNTFMRFFLVHESGAKRYNYEGIVTFVTIDNYEEILESYGYGVAIQTKSSVAGVLDMSIRSSDLVSHVGEDSGEFCILMPDTPKENVGTVVERIESRIKSVAVHAGNDIIHPRLSYDTVTYPNGKLSPQECLAPENRKPFKVTIPA